MRIWSLALGMAAVLTIGVFDATCAQGVPDTTVARQTGALQSAVDRLQRVKLSGYVQARFESHEDAQNASVDADGKIVKSNPNNLYIRRARLKTQYQAAKTSRFVFFLDAGKDRLRLLEAFIELAREFGDIKAALAAGQHTIPFGYEIEYSSSKRDFPERSTAERELFAGERDRLVNLTIQAGKHVSANAAVLNGTGIEDKDFTWESPFRNRKNYLGRIRASGQIDRVKLQGGISGYIGDRFDPADSVDHRVDRDRWGADAQVFAELIPSLGETSLRGEIIWANEKNKNARGGYLWLAQKLGRWFGAAARVDTYDPDTDKKDGRKLTQMSLAAHCYYDENVRLTVAYDARRTEEVGGQKDLADDITTAQVQFAF